MKSFDKTIFELIFNMGIAFNVPKRLCQSPLSQYVYYTVPVQHFYEMNHY